MPRKKILIYDIETSYLEVKTWNIFNQFIAPDKIKKDWHLLSWSAKWLGEKKIMYMDQRSARDVANDKKLVKGLWKLLDEADIVLTQNGKKFDQPRVYARLAHHDLPPPSPSKHIDTRQISKKNLGFTSNSLAYLAKFLGVPEHFWKFQHKKFPGMELWDECLAGNRAAWNEMEKYNKRDVLCLEAVYKKLRRWDSSVNVTLSGSGCRSCGSYKLQARGYNYTLAGMQQRYQCTECGAWMKDSKNLLSKNEKNAIKRPI